MKPLFTRARFARLAGYTATQGLVQAVGFLGGIVLVRSMEQSQYGHYALAVGMIGVANVLLDLGLATAVLALGGALRGDRRRTGALVRDAHALQSRFTAGGVLLLVPVFAAMFAGQGLGFADVATLTVLAFACSAFNARSQLALSLVRLRGDIALQQRLEIGANAGKLLAILAATTVFIDARVALGLTLATSLGTFAVLRRDLRRHIDLSAQGTHENDGALHRFVRQQAPNSLYYCASGQLSIWLIGLSGHADRVAEAGALSRLAVVFTLIGAVVTALVQPWFARAGTRHELVSGFTALNLFFAALTTLLTGLAMAVPGAMLWILGPQYAGLRTELVWMVMSACFISWSGAAYAVGAARGWVVPTWLVVPFGIGTMLLSIWLLDVSTVVGGFQMNTATAAVATLLFVAFVGLRIGQPAVAQLAGERA